MFTLRKRHCNRASRPKRRLKIESLERRAMLTAYFVDPAAAEGGTGAANDPFDSIQAAIDAAAETLGPDTVMIRPGTYEENLDIEDSDGITLQGLGNVLIQPADAGEDLVKVEGDATLRNITIEGGDRGIDAEDGAFTFVNVHISGTESDALRIRDGSSVLIMGSSFNGSTDGDGIDLEADDLDKMGSIVIVNSSAIGNADEGLEVDNALSILVLGGHYSQNADEGIDIDNTSQITVLGVTANGNGGAGLQVEAGGEDDPDVDVISRVWVVNSTFEDNEGDGVEIVEGEFEDPDTGEVTTDGLIESVSLTDVAVRGNGERGLDIRVSGSVRRTRVISENNAEPDVF